MTRALIGAGFVVAALSWTFWSGKQHERGLWEARVATLTAERDRHAARLAGLAEAYEAERERRAVAEATLERLADEDPDADRIALPERAVDRLRQRGAR